MYVIEELTIRKRTFLCDIQHGSYIVNMQCQGKCIVSLQHNCSAATFLARLPLHWPQGSCTAHRHWWWGPQCCMGRSGSSPGGQTSSALSPPHGSRPGRRGCSWTHSHGSTSQGCPVVDCMMECVWSMYIYSTSTPQVMLQCMGNHLTITIQTTGPWITRCLSTSPNAYLYNCIAGDAGQLQDETKQLYAVVLRQAMDATMSWLLCNF